MKATPTKVWRDIEYYKPDGGDSDASTVASVEDVGDKASLAQLARDRFSPVKPVKLFDHFTRCAAPVRSNSASLAQQRSGSPVIAVERQVSPVRLTRVRVVSPVRHVSPIRKVIYQRTASPVIRRPLHESRIRRAQPCVMRSESVILPRPQDVQPEEDARTLAQRKLDALVRTAGETDVRRVSIDKLKKMRQDIYKAIKQASSVDGVNVQDAQATRRRLHNYIQDTLGQVRVLARVRPMSEKEIADNEEQVVFGEGDTKIKVKSQNGHFEYNSVLVPGSQEDVFDECRDLVQSVVDGYNVTVFSYGATGTGKTYTMFGSHADPGIARRAVTELFTLIKDQPHVKVFASARELYKKDIVDLVKGEKEVKDATELLQLLEQGLQVRSCAAHCLNDTSSRSHFILTITLRGHGGGAAPVCSKLVLCDLAGSERLKETEAVGDRKAEAIEINKSLTALGTVMQAVAKNEAVVSYRGHVLTNILRDAIGGTAKTLMVVTCSPAKSRAGETACVLSYGQRAKQIFNRRI